MSRCPRRPEPIRTVPSRCHAGGPGGSTHAYSDALPEPTEKGNQIVRGSAQGRSISSELKFCLQAVPELLLLPAQFRDASRNSICPVRLLYPITAGCCHSVLHQSGGNTRAITASYLIPPISSHVVPRQAARKGPGISLHGQSFESISVRRRPSSRVSIARRKAHTPIRRSQFQGRSPLSSHSRPVRNPTS